MAGQPYTERREILESIIPNGGGWLSPPTFPGEDLRTLTRRLEPLRRPDSPFEGPVPSEYARPAVWVEPRLVVEVSFDRWTRAGRMIAPVYQGLRDDRDPADVVREA